jgi:hypothetical protein
LPGQSLSRYFFTTSCALSSGILNPSSTHIAASSLPRPAKHSRPYTRLHLTFSPYTPLSLPTNEFSCQTESLALQRGLQRTLLRPVRIRFLPTLPLKPRPPLKSGRPLRGQIRAPSRHRPSQHLSLGQGDQRDRKWQILFHSHRRQNIHLEQADAGER